MALVLLYAHCPPSRARRGLLTIERYQAARIYVLRRSSKIALITSDFCFQHGLSNSTWTISLSVVSEARVSKLHTRARCVCALSIQRLEGRRWRLRRMRANGYGNSNFLPICKLLVLRDLKNEYVRETQFETLRCG